MAEQLLIRARQLVAAGPYDARASEIAAVHAAIYPERDAVCETCPRELGPAFFAIQRWAAQQGAAGDAPFSPSFMSQPQARFKSDTTVYTPHGLGVAYSNDNLTNKAARDILAADPDAADLFKVLPPDATDEELAAEAAAVQVHESPAASAPAKASAAPASPESRLVPASVPADFDYKQLASAMLDEVERRQALKDSEESAADNEADDAEDNLDEDDADTTPNTSDANQSNSSDNAGSAEGDSHHGEGHEGERPVRLSRMNKDQLVAAHTAELGHAPAAELTNDDIRAAIGQHRASQQDPE